MTSLIIGLGIVLISLLTAKYIFKKYRRGATLSKLEKITLIVGLIVDFVFLASILSPSIPVVSEILGALPLEAKWLISFLLVIIPIGLGLIVWEKNRISLDPKFKDLKIYYSSAYDTPDTEHPQHPYYVVNNCTRQAYYVPNLIADSVRKHKISWDSYPDKERLLAYFKKQSIVHHNTDASDRELGLWLRPSGVLALAEPQLTVDLLERLKKRKLEGRLKDFDVAYLNPWYCWFLRFRFVEDRVSPPSKRIMANIISKKALSAPFECFDLTSHLLVGSDRYSPRPWEDISAWCKRKKGWTFCQGRITVEELLGDYQ